MNKHNKHSRMAMIVVGLISVFAIILVGLWPRIQFEIDCLTVRHTLRQVSGKDFGAEMPVLSSGITQIDHDDGAPTETYEIHDGVTIAVPAGTTLDDGRVLRLATARLEVTLILSDFNHLGSHVIRSVRNSRARDYLLEYLAGVSRHQLARDILASDCRAIRTGSIEERYKTMYLCSMKAVLMPHYASNRSIEFTTGRIHGFLFGDYQRGDMIMVEATSERGDTFVTLLFKNTGDATDADVFQLLSTLAIKEG